MREPEISQRKELTTCENMNIEQLRDIYFSIPSRYRQITFIEAVELYKLAKEEEAEGDIVEIGTGTSTIFMALGSEESGRRHIHTIDNKTSVQELTKFLSPDLITAIKGDSLDIAAKWHGPIRLLFLDGNHSYDYVRKEFELLEPWLSINGLVIFHDAIPTNPRDPYRAFVDLMSDKTFTDIKYIDDSTHEHGMAIARKIRGK